MQRWGVEPSARQGVLQKLLADRFIDDNRYAEAFVRDKIRLSGWGAARSAPRSGSKASPQRSSMKLLPDWIRRTSPNGCGHSSKKSSD